ncbi:MAG: porin family protein [Alphaproteobacteria bacterium]|nr:porin family protein [Alphaproteobacteria bacterium]
MKKLLLMAVATTALFASQAANAGEYMPYVGFDYVNMTPNVSDRFPNNYDIGSIVAGVKFVDLGSIEAFAERSMQEKKKFDNSVIRGRVYGYGLDLLGNIYNVSDASILGTIGYGRISAKLKYNGAGEKDTGNTLRLGVGGEINPTPEWGFRAMYRYSLSDSDAFKNAKEFTIGARYYFY